MLSMNHKAQDFFGRSWSWVYRRTIRHVMPVKEPVRYAGVAIDLERKWGDRLIPSFQSMLADVPLYEEALIRGLNMYVKPGMTVVVIGGGIGVTTVVAANLVGPTGKVICFEGSLLNVRRIRETVRRNRVTGQVTVHYGVVGPAIAVYHEDNAAPQIKPGDLPHCDVLEMDCEGSEKAIISTLEARPRHILVETHGVYGAPTGQIEELLKTKGYDATNLGPAEPRVEAHCIQHDIRVIAATHRTV
jgi:hypothetical protein